MMEGASPSPFRTATRPAEQVLALYGPEQLAERLKAIQSITDAALSHLELEELLDELLGRLRDALSVDTVRVLLGTAEGRALRVRARIGLEEEVEPEIAIPIGQGLAGRVAAHREAVIVDDLSQVEVANPLLRRLSSMMVAPLLVEGKLLGVLKVGSIAPRAFTDGDLSLLQTAADRVALAIDHAQRYEELQREIHTREQAAQSLRESEERFRVFSESASDAIFAIDGESVILYANPAATRIFGYAAEELLGQRMTLLIPERLRAAHRAGVERYLATSRRNIPWKGVLLPGLHRNGEEIPLEISFGEYSKDGRRYFTGIARDVRERVAQQHALEETAAELEATVEELQLRTEQAEAADQAKSDFLAVMSHELRTPLSAILGFAELLQLGIPTAIPEESQAHVNRIIAAAHHQLQLIEEILSFSRLSADREELELDRVDVVELTREAVAFVQPGAEKKGLPLQVELPERPVRVVTDRTKLRQVLANLLSNAIKFTSDGTIRVAVERQQDGVVLRVQDTGIGIAPEHLEKIFDPFWQVQQSKTREVEGVGLGLTISRRLVQMLNGDIRVESTPGEGTTFTLRLPLSAGSATDEK